MEKTRNILSWAFIAIIVLGFALYLSFLFNRNYQLTNSSFGEINDIHKELVKLSGLSKKYFNSKDDLVFETNNIIDPNIFDEYYFLKYYIFKDGIRVTYKPDKHYLEKEIVNVQGLDSILNKVYNNLDSLMIDVQRITGNNEFALKSWHYSSNSEYIYYIPAIKKLMIPDDLLNKLYELKDVSYKSEEEYEHALKKNIGIEDFNTYSSLLLAVTDRHSTFQWRALIILLILLFISIIGLWVTSSIIEKREKEKSTTELDNDIGKAKEEIKQNPDKVLPVWDLANFTLQKYYNKNLEQVNSIYKLSIAVMIMGFMLIISVLITNVFFSLKTNLDQIGIIAGIITEFIGATFLFIYKSTINQALQHSKSLEKINNVGMAIKIIESIKVTDDNQSKIDDAKIVVSKELITTHNNVYKK